MFRFIRKSQSGQILQGMLFGGLSLVVVMVLVSIRTVRTQFTNRKLRDDIAQTQLSSGIETMTLAYRLAEMAYIQAVSGCDSANTFMRALQQGSGCDSAMSVTVFTGTDLGSGQIPGDILYNYTGPGCTITQSSSSCAVPNGMPILTIGGTANATLKSQDINGIVYQMNMEGADPSKQILQMQAVIQNPQGKTFNNEFSIRASVPNLAHMELSDGRITQEHPNPLSKCSGTAWGTFYVYDVNYADPTNPSNKCAAFQQLGGGTGLAYYNNLYFGFRPADGQVIDLLAVNDGDSYLVNEDGTLNGVSEFPFYSKDLLINHDDITVSGQQIQSVHGLGPSAQISVLANDGSGTPVLTTVCNLGNLGWSQAYAGIAALNWNDPLYPPPTDPNDIRLAEFMLKTDSGDLLEAAVTATSANGYTCMVFKDSAQQVIEYKRSGGFDRTDDVLPYYIY